MFLCGREVYRCYGVAQRPEVECIEKFLIIKRGRYFPSAGLPFPAGREAVPKCGVGGVAGRRDERC